MGFIEALSQWKSNRELLEGQTVPSVFECRISKIDTRAFEVIKAMAQGWRGIRKGDHMWELLYQTSEQPPKKVSILIGDECIRISCTNPQFIADVKAIRLEKRLVSGTSMIIKTPSDSEQVTVYLDKLVMMSAIRDDDQKLYIGSIGLIAA
ncbi:MAG: hypothetical protein HY424_00900 [Candidatus Levybacteria bacterium]|nr:hypothetical protein [Candidatus Levybacteria bacterium]